MPDCRLSSPWADLVWPWVATGIPPGAAMPGGRRSEEARPDWALLWELRRRKDVGMGGWSTSSLQAVEAPWHSEVLPKILQLSAQLRKNKLDMPQSKVEF